MQQKTNILSKSIVKSITVKASAKECFEKWTTSEGISSFFCPNNLVELKIGGPYEIYFDMNQPNGLRGSEGCKILSFLPNQMFSFSWNAPPHLAEVRKSKHKAWVVVTFNESNTNETTVELTHLGWIEGPQWDEVFQYFERAWSFVINNFDKSFEE